MRAFKSVFPMAIFILCVCCTSAVSKTPLNIYGTWEIYRYVEVGGHGPKTTATLKKSIGVKIEFGRDHMDCSGDSLVAKKGFYKDVKYRWKIRKYNFENGYLYKDGYDDATLAFWDVDGAFVEKTVRMIISIEEGWEDYFEVTNKGELAIYGDGYFVFLKKLK